MTTCYTEHEDSGVPGRVLSDTGDMHTRWAHQATGRRPPGAGAGSGGNHSSDSSSGLAQNTEGNVCQPLTKAVTTQPTSALNTQSNSGKHGTQLLTVHQGRGQQRPGLGAARGASRPPCGWNLLWRPRSYFAERQTGSLGQDLVKDTKAAKITFTPTRDFRDPGVQRPGASTETLVQSGPPRGRSLLLYPGQRSLQAVAATHPARAVQ